MNPDLTAEVSHGVTVLILNRPDKLNAYTAVMGRLLGEACRPAMPTTPWGNPVDRRRFCVLRRCGFQRRDPFAAPMSAALCKRLLWDTAINGYTPQQVTALETQLHHRVMGSPDAREGMAAFVNRRTPQWSSPVSTEWTDLPDPDRY